MKTYTVSMITLCDKNAQPLDLFLRMTENQLARIYEPAPGLFVAESLKVIERALLAGYEPLSLLTDEQMLPCAEQLLSKDPAYTGVPLYLLSPEVIPSIRGFDLTGGLLCLMHRRPLYEAKSLIQNARRIAVLEDVENPTNVGAIFRSAAALGIDAVLLSKGCADPLYRRAARVSMGNVFCIPWTFLKDIGEVKEAGFRTAAMALTGKSVPPDDPALKKEDRLAILLGNENNGLTEETVKNSDYTVKIPMSREVDSLNVAAAAAVAFWELGGKNQ